MSNFNPHTGKIIDRELAEESLIEEVRKDAGCALRSGHAYVWKFYDSKIWKVQPALINFYDFMQAHNDSDLEEWVKIAINDSKKAHHSAIEYMIETITGLELEAWTDEMCEQGRL